MTYVQNKVKTEKNGVEILTSEKEIVIHVYNNGKIPINIRIEGFRNKRVELCKLYGDIKKDQSLVPIEPLESIFEKQIKFYRIEPYSISEPFKFDVKWLKNHLENNKINLEKDVEILFREIGGQYKSVIIKAKEIKIDSFNFSLKIIKYILIYKIETFNKSLFFLYK
ncbi:hypothetical protein [Facklamia miroungae]|nr:hypothetical protein [Facklamia miroungae]NKZ29229.1 hypothetical protein [Facklamia miroungae]